MATDEIVKKSFENVLWTMYSMDLPQHLELVLTLVVFVVSLVLVLPTAHLTVILGYVVGVEVGFLLVSFALGLSIPLSYVGHKFLTTNIRLTETILGYAKSRRGYLPTMLDIIALRLNPLIPFPVGTYLLIINSTSLFRNLTISIIAVAPLNFLTLALGAELDFQSDAHGISETSILLGFFIVSILLAAISLGRGLINGR